MKTVEVVIVNVELEIIVELPEGVTHKNGKLSQNCRDRAVEAAMLALPETTEIFLDGKDKDPVKIKIHADEAFCVQDVWVEPK